MKRLEVLGFWFNEQAPTSLPRPQLLVGGLSVQDRNLLVSYLRQGKTLVRYPEPSFCRFACGEAEMGRADLTDGTFVWPEGLAHYLDRHDVRLPQHFLTHVQQRNGSLAPFTPPKPTFGLFDTGPWLAWGIEQRACLDLAGWDTPTGDVLDRISADLGEVEHEAILLCRGSTREVVLAMPSGSIEVHQLRVGGHPPQQFAGWHEWPIAGEGTRDDHAAIKPPSKPGRGLTMGEFFADLKKRRGPEAD
jgi:hypothetical protein